jgi:hypothetical protein
MCDRKYRGQAKNVVLALVADESATLHGKCRFTHRYVAKKRFLRIVLKAIFEPTRGW